MTSIGDRIKQKRISMNMSQEELAHKIGYKSRVSINKIELSGRDLPADKIYAIALALNTTPAYIMGWEEDNTDKEAELLLISAFRELSAADKQQLLRYAEFLAKTK